MGAVRSGIPEELVLQMKEIWGCDVFIESGTFKGGTTKWASKYFTTVHTIEKAEAFYNEYSGELAQIAGVKPHLGDSRTVLPSILKELGTEKVIFWLDSHWCGGGSNTAGKDEEGECPIVGELVSIVKWGGGGDINRLRS
jgi:hypothetical protein